MCRTSSQWRPPDRSSSGSFTLKGMPAGQYVLGFVQEKLGEQDSTVTVKPQAVTTADETFTMNPAT